MLCNANKPCLERAADLLNCLHACSVGALRAAGPRAASAFHLALARPAQADKVLR